jgi:3-phenylpropionate/trans-cinnamate dioxygenase ferredoxin reductase subunit
MTKREGQVVIAGASLAGATVASALRREGFDGSVTLIGDEPYLPYERPPLSKELIRGTKSVDDAYVNPASFYATQGIDVRFGHVRHVDVLGREVILSDEEAVRFDRLVVTTGGRPKRPPIPGLELSGVRTLRSLEDAIAIHDASRTATSAVIVGLGFVGSEVASSLRHAGLDVVAVDVGTAPLAGPLGPEVARAVEQMHRNHGVDLVLGESVVRFVGDRAVEGVITSTGKLLEGDLVVVGLGTEPNVELLRDSPVAVSDGVIVDEFGRTSVGGIYAAGDVANHWHPVARRRLRVEHWNNAVKQGRAVANEILGQGKPYDDVHFFWTEHYGEELQYYGLHEPWDDVVVRGDVAAHDFTAIYRLDGRIVAGAGMGRSTELKNIKRLIADRARLPGAWLANDDLELDTFDPVDIGTAA